jgi:hypothetical protein
VLQSHPSKHALGCPAAPANHTRVPVHESRASAARRSAAMEMECGNEGSSLQLGRKVQAIPGQQECFTLVLSNVGWIIGALACRPVACM